MSHSLQLSYPQARRDDVVETLHGVKVADPYRWMEKMDSPEVKSWVEAENKLTQSVLDTIPERGAIRERLTKLWNYERFGAPTQRGNRFFWTKNDGLQNQAVWYMSDGLNGTPRVLIDPNTLSKDGTVAVGSVAFSDDGKLLAYGVQSGGSDWVEWHVRDVATGKDLPDKIEWSKFSGASFTKDGRGFYYSRYDAPKSGNKLQNANYYHKLYYHGIGTPQSKDRLVYERKDQKSWGFSGDVTEDGRYLIITVWTGTERETRVFIQDLQGKGSKIVETLPDADARYSVFGNVGSTLYMVTDKGAPNGKVVSMDAAKGKASMKTIVAESKHVLDNAAIMGGKLVLQYLQDAHSSLQICELSGKPIQEVHLPAVGTVGSLSGRATEKNIFFSFMTFNYPTTIFRYDLGSSQLSTFRKPNVAIDPTKFEVKQVFYKSLDGTKVPMFIAYKKGLPLNGMNPTLLYGYGGFQISETPWFSISSLVWMEMGGVYAVACLRGGGEYGTKWHDAGRLKNKQNVFDDFAAAGQYLINEMYTSTPKLAINGGSNGGLLVGASIVQRPRLWGAAIADVGVLDMLRFHKFTIGWGWVSDYGSPDKEEDFRTLLKYSPYHNIKEGVSYPPTLITTGDHDDRVVPLHSFKFAAQLQHAQSGENPILIRIETRAGHGAGKPMHMIIDEITDKYGFLVKMLHVKVPDNFGKG